MLNDLIKYISENGWGNVIGAIVLYFVIMVGNKLIKKVFPEKANMHINASIPLTQHSYFQFLEDAINYKIGSFEFASKKKKEIFTIYLKIIYRTIFNRYKIFLQDDRLLTYNTSELKAAFLNEIKLTIEDYNGKAREIGIPEIVISRVYNFYAIVLSDIVDEVGNTIDNPYYQSNYARINAVMNLYKFSTEILLNTAKGEFDKLNGQLEKEIVDIKLLGIIL